MGPNGYNGKKFENMSSAEKQAYYGKVQELLHALHGTHTIGDESTLHGTLQKAAELGMVYYPDGKQLSPDEARVAGKDSRNVPDLLIVAHNPDKHAREMSYYQFNVDGVNASFDAEKPMLWQDVVEKQDLYQDADILNKNGLEAYVADALANNKEPLSQEKTPQEHKDHLLYAASFGLVTFADGTPFVKEDVEKLISGRIPAGDLVVTLREDPEDVSKRSKYGFVLKDGKLHLDTAHPLTESMLKDKYNALVNRKTPKELVMAIAAEEKQVQEYFFGGNNSHLKLPSVQMSNELEKLGMIQSLNEKSFIHLQPENEVYRVGSAEPMTQDEFVEYTAGLKQPQKPTGLFVGFREWFHKYVHTLKDFAEYDHKVKEYEIKKFDICEKAGLDVSGKAETIEQYKRDVEEKNQKDLAAAMDKIRRTCRNSGLVDCDRLVNSFENAVTSDWEVGKYLMQAIPKLDMMECYDLQWKLNSAGVDTHVGFGSAGSSAGNPISDREMQISAAVSFMHVCKGYLPSELQEKVEAKYAEEKEPYVEYKKKMQKLQGTQASTELYHKWMSGDYKKEYWENKNAVQVDANVEKKPSEMPKDELLEFAQKNAELVKAEMQNEQKQLVSEKAAELGLDEQQAQQAINAANNGIGEANEEVVSEVNTHEMEQPQVNAPVN